MFTAESRKKDAEAGFSHILVPFKGTAGEQRMLKAACKMAQTYRARLSIVHVLEVPMNLPINTDSPFGVDEANVILDQAEDIARINGIKTSGDLLQSRDAGHAIVEEASDRKADLIVMEAKHDVLPGMPALGRTVDYVIRHATCAVWICRM